MKDVSEDEDDVCVWGGGCCIPGGVKLLTGILL